MATNITDTQVFYDSTHITRVQAINTVEQTKATAQNSAYTNPPNPTAQTVTISQVFDQYAKRTDSDLPKV